MIDPGPDVRHVIDCGNSRVGVLLRDHIPNVLVVARANHGISWQSQCVIIPVPGERPFDVYLRGVSWAVEEAKRRRSPEYKAMIQQAEDDICDRILHGE